jgi:hypothetical protein
VLFHTQEEVFYTRPQMIFVDVYSMYLPINKVISFY